MSRMLSSTLSTGTSGSIPTWLTLRSRAASVPSGGLMRDGSSATADQDNDQHAARLRPATPYRQLPSRWQPLTQDAPADMRDIRTYLNTPCQGVEHLDLWE